MAKQSCFIVLGNVLAIAVWHQQRFAAIRTLDQIVNVKLNKYKLSIMVSIIPSTNNHTCLCNQSCANIPY